MPLNKVSVTSILGDKASSLYTIPVDSMVDVAISEMNRQRIGSLMVKDGDECVGIFTERDALTRVVLAEHPPKQIRLCDVMTRDFQFIEPNTSVEDAMQIMTDKRVRHLPILEGDSKKLVGMISIGDVTRWLLKANELEAENLRRYVFSEYPG